MKPTRKQLEEAVKKLVTTEINNSWKGGGDPADIPSIEKDLEIAKLKLKMMLGELFSRKIQ